MGVGFRIRRSRKGRKRGREGAVFRRLSNNASPSVARPADVLGGSGGSSAGRAGRAGDTDQATPAARL